MSQRAEADTLYFVSTVADEQDTIHCVVEVDGDSVAGLGPEFQKLSLDDLHALGLLAPTEQVALVAPGCVSFVEETPGFVAKSWVRTWTEGIKDMAEAGSMTQRPNNGVCYLHAQYRRYEDGQQIYSPSPGRVWTRHSTFIALDWTSSNHITRTILHVERGEHAWQYPPEGVIVTEMQTER
ncbi:MAG: hypothetical protein ABIK37_06845 [candidate division WOR-3 bacterium]